MVNSVCVEEKAYVRMKLSMAVWIAVEPYTSLEEETHVSVLKGSYACHETS
jgi:hypothetical protein